MPLIFFHVFLIIIYLYKVIGKQTTDVWVFNKTIQIDDTGSLIPREAQGYILLDDTSLPVLSGITSVFITHMLQSFSCINKVCIFLSVQYCAHRSLPPENIPLINVY